MFKDKLNNLNLTKINWEEVKELNSSLINKFSYVSEKEILLIKFQNSSDIYYYNIPSSVYKSFLMSESKGSFFHKKIKSHYPWMKEEV